MKKLIAIILSAVILVSFGAVSASAYQDNEVNAAVVSTIEEEPTAEENTEWYDVTLGVAVNSFVDFVRTVVAYICSVLNISIPAL